MPKLHVYNSLTRKKEEFSPLDPTHIRVYACGPTVYNYAHIGNARMAVVFDLLARVLRSLYPKVTYASNITDVDDKIMAAAKETGEPIEAITQKFTRIYNEDMSALGVAMPDIQPKATETIPEMIELMEQLIERGHAYEAEGHVLFHVPSFEKYGGLSGRSRDEQIAGARVDVAPYKKDPADFVLWKPSSEEQVGWDSPWGRGRPGWHIECSAMSAKHLGLPFDIHGGGADLKFPHHENEIAQSCCASGHEDDLSAFAKYWMHNGFLTVEGEKMSKSLGNFLLAHDLIEKYPGPVLRLALLSAHYRQPLDWTEKRLEESQKLYDRIRAVLGSLEDIEMAGTDEICEPVLEALCDDLNTPLAFAKLAELIKEINKAVNLYASGNRDRDQVAFLKSILHNSLKLLGIKVIAMESGEQGQNENNGINTLLAERTKAKLEKNFARADEIRDQLAAQGIEIIDTPEGPKWRKA